jgi:hypothetical protein
MEKILKTDSHLHGNIGNLYICIDYRYLALFNHLLIF